MFCSQNKSSHQFNDLTCCQSVNCSFWMQNKFTGSQIFYAPNFGEVEGAYWFGPVCPSVHLSVTLWQLRYSRTAYARILKLYVWHAHEK